MRVGMLIWNYAPGPQGGTERQCARVVPHLGRCGVDCTVITRWPGGAASRHERVAGAAIVRLGALGGVVRRAQRWRDRLHPGGVAPGNTLSNSLGESPHLRRRRFGFMTPFLQAELLGFMGAAWGFLSRRSGEFDVLHVHESHWIAGFGAWLGRRCRIPVLVKEASFPVLMPVPEHVPLHRRWSEWRLRADYQAQSEAAAHDLASHLEPGRRVHVVPNGVDLPAKTADPARNQDVLYVGNLSQGVAWKAFDVLLEAWARVAPHHPQSRLVVVGGGDSAPLLAEARRLGVSHSVVCAGSQEETGPFFERAAAFVLPSRREGMSNALLEAQSWGLPCVVSAIPGNLAVVRDGENGLVFPVDDAATCAERLGGLLADGNRRSHLGTRARQIAEQSFAFAQVTPRLVAAYRSVASAIALDRAVPPR
jgi:glycosyltransferase involved in cell wall biosynthesis